MNWNTGRTGPATSTFCDSSDALPAVAQGRRVTTQDTGAVPRRLRILDAEEIEALYGRPRFTDDDRSGYFTLT